MTSWAAFERSAPELAAAGRQLFYQYGVGLAFLATVRPDGGPRLHPICVIAADGGLFAFLVPSLKRDDLERGGQYALHAMLPEAVDDEFYVTGVATRVDDPERTARVAAAYQNPVQPAEQLFEFSIERALLARYQFRGEWPPAYTRWQAGSTPAAPSTPPAPPAPDAPSTAPR